MPQPETPQNPKDNEEIQREAVKEARAKIIDKFHEKRSGLQSGRITFAEAFLKEDLLKPIRNIDKEWTAKRRVLQEMGEDLGRLQEEFKPKLDELANFGAQYIEKITAVTGELSPEVLAQFVHSATQSARLYTELLEKSGNEDLKEAIKWSIGIAVVDMPTSKAKVIPILKTRIREEFPKGDKSLMPVIWMVLAFSSIEDRLEVAGDYVKYLQSKGKTEEIEAFLEDGNKKGVLAYEDMVDLRGGARFADEAKEKEEKQKCAELYKLQNDFSKQAKTLASTSYGVRNVWDDVTGGSILRFLLKAAAGLTIAGNVLANVWKGGIKGIPKLITNKNVLLAGGVYAGTKLYESDVTAKDALKPKEEREALSERQALETLKRFRRETPFWPQLDTFFKTDDFQGGREFWEYVRGMKEVHKNNAFAKMDGQNFKEYLDARVERAKKYENKVEEEKFTKLAKAFTDIKAENLGEIARVFDYFNLGGKSTDIAKYQATLERAEKFNA